MSNRVGRLIDRRLRNRDELAVLARLFRLRVVTGRSVGLRQAVGDALHAGTEHRQ